MIIDIQQEKVRRGYWYLATPYSKWVHGLDDADVVARALAGRLLIDGWIVYAPIAHSHGISKTMQGFDPRDHDFWMRADKPLFQAACGLLVADLPGWKNSVGVTMEIDWCRGEQKPAFLLDPDKLTIRQL